MTESNKRRAIRPITVGDSPKFQAFLAKYGLDKERFLDIAGKNADTFTQEIYLRAKALDIYRDTTEATIDLYNATHSRGITLFDDLIDLTVSIQLRRDKQMALFEAEGKEYDPLADDTLQRALIRKADLIARIDKMKFDVKKLMLEYKGKRLGMNEGDDAFTISDMEFGDGNTTKDIERNSDMVDSADQPVDSDKKVTDSGI